MSCIRRQQCNQLFECIIVYNTPVFRICCRRLYQYYQRARPVFTAPWQEAVSRPPETQKAAPGLE